MTNERRVMVFPVPVGICTQGCDNSKSSSFGRLLTLRMAIAIAIVHPCTTRARYLEQAVPSCVEGPFELQHVPVLLGVDELIGEISEARRVDDSEWCWVISGG